jgi:spore maturation protein CgeB
MRVVIFCHSIISDWNHGNAHFLRGIATELMSRGHALAIYEPRDAWSVMNLLSDYGEHALTRFREAYPHFGSIRYDLASLDLDEALNGADLVLVHEWNDHALVARIGRHHARGGRYLLLFHDTHHRSVTEPESMASYDLSCYDGVLAFGAVIRDIYAREGWGRRAWTWHEAADTRVFYPISGEAPQGDVLWIGNWGDGERTGELEEFLLQPVRDLNLRARIHGVRYPEAAIQRLRSQGIDFGGWLPNFEAPRVYSRFKATVHVPRRPYAQALPGIPTIRVFEALACGIPLVSAPWCDAEGLFTPGRDFLLAGNGAQMRSCLDMLLADEGMRSELSQHGRRTILARHTCVHRVDELMEICAAIGLRAQESQCTNA